MYQVRAVANWFIQKGILEGNPIEQMKLMKLVYVAQGLSLAVNIENPLCDAVIEAWKYGPVIRDLYHEVKVNGNKPIRDLLPQDEMFIELNEDVTDYKPPIIPSTDKQRVKLLEAVWKEFGKYSGIQLSNWTHIEESPWYKAWHEDGGKQSHSMIIGKPALKNYFESFLRLNDKQKAA